jgi:L-ascorbate metabolism protein UlaG (beta-lactamase superfamily)
MAGTSSAAGKTRPVLITRPASCRRNWCDARGIAVSPVRETVEKQSTVASDAWFSYEGRVTPKRRFLNRRNFLFGSFFAGMGAAWMTTSSSWTARFFRERFKELGRGVPAAPQKPVPGDWSDHEVTVAWLGHATVLINFFGVRILTDPAFFSRIGVDLWVGSLGPKRLTACALKPGELPEIDLLLVSHAHFDHLDIPSLAAVRGRPPVIMGPGTSDLLPRKHYSEVRELRWEESATVKTRHGEVRVRSIEVKHWGARVRRDTWRGYAGFVLEREGRKLLFGGDTADTPAFAEHRKHGPFDAAIMPIGAYDPWIRSHCTPEQAVALADAAGARLIVPVHHRTFKLSNEPFDEPFERVQEALAGEPERLAVREIGGTLVIKG